MILLGDFICGILMAAMALWYPLGCHLYQQAVLLFLQNGQNHGTAPKQDITKRVSVERKHRRDDNENIIQNPRFDDGLNSLCERCCKIVLHADGKVLPMSGKVFASTENCTENSNAVQQEITGAAQRKPASEGVGAVRIFGYIVGS
ncbi:Endo-1,4-beta-xylanase 1 [Sesamum alatum]|uniref:Endo-1,4-beta-xylanase 1 n=1 Tax=Sesamum alatum TaxID=300844 RepID=A0AAE1XRK2_9LAMI|nr:Endo-1,4-beta-xylanase 1 [Sesamum alatum]